MALSKEKKQAIMDKQAGSKLMVDAVKVPFEELQGRELTIVDYDPMGSDDPDNDKHRYFVVTFAELPGSYTFSGSALTKLIIEAEGLDEDQVMEDALEAGAADFEADEDIFDITTEPEDFSGVRDDLTAKGYTFLTAELQMVPDVLSTIDDPDAIKNMEKLLDMLEDNDDVQDVWHNWDRPDED